MIKQMTTAILLSMLSLGATAGEDSDLSSESTYVNLDAKMQYGPARLIKNVKDDGGIEYRMHLTGKHYNESEREITLNHPASKIVGYTTSDEFCDPAGCGYKFDIETTINEFYVDSKKDTGFKVQLRSGDLKYNYSVSKAALSVL